jgi:hypothetical protein
MTSHELEGGEAQERAARRLRVALELHGAGVALQRQNLRRRHPGCSEAELDALMKRWLLDARGWEGHHLRRRDER